MLLGLAVGAAQLFKYNGWLAGAIVLLSAARLAGDCIPASGGPGRELATWGLGPLAALVAALVYWPWFAFVQSHGGYGALLAHQRGYLGGFASWPGHLAAQLAQSTALSGGAALARVSRTRRLGRRITHRHSTMLTAAAMSPLFRSDAR